MAILSETIPSYNELIEELNSKYQKPSGGIPDSDIASSSTWNSKYQKPSGGIPDSDIASSSTWNNKVDRASNEAQVIELNPTNPNSYTVLYLRSNNSNDREVDLGFRDKTGANLGFFLVKKADREPYYDFDNGSDYRALLISSNIKSSRIYNGYSRKIFKGSVGFLPDIGSNGSATFTFNGIEGHSPTGTATSQTIVSHRLTAWFCTKAGKTGASGDSNYYKLIVLQMPASLLDLSAIGSRTFMIPKNNNVTLTVTGIGGAAKSISYIADETWKNTLTGE